MQIGISAVNNKLIRSLEITLYGLKIIIEEVDERFGYRGKSGVSFLLKHGGEENG